MAIPLNFVLFVADILAIQACDSGNRAIRGSVLRRSGAIQNNEMVNIQEIVTYHYVHTGSDPPLEDESWDHELFSQYVESRHQDQKVQCSVSDSEPSCAQERLPSSCRRMQFLRSSCPSPPRQIAPSSLGEFDSKSPCAIASSLPERVCDGPF